MLTAKNYYQLTGVILFIVGLVHLLRLVSGWVVVINGWEVPVWASVVALVVTWYLAYNAYVLSGKKK